MDRTTEDGSEEWRSPLVDVSDMSLPDLADAVASAGADTPLARSLRRLADELDDPGEPIAGFNSAI